MFRFTCLFIMSVGVLVAQPDQKFSLGTPDGARFSMSDITWPATHGDADVCLWADDKLAATCITIDDNCAFDHEWWLHKGDSLDFKFTWFVITGPVSGVADPGRIAKYGTWSHFRTIYERGHAVQSHSVAHGDNSIFQTIYGDSVNYYEEWDWYYGGAVAIIEDSIPGNKCYTLAAPGSGTNNMDTAMHHHIANRGGTAWPNNANALDFNSIKTTSAFSENFILTIVTDTATVWGKNFRRGLSCFVWHDVASVDKKAAATEALTFIKAHHDSLWVGTYPDVVRYNMEYATHALIQTGLSDTAVSFTVTDSMADSIYTYPLTVKVRLNNDWDTCIATQNGEAAEVTVVEHEGDKYALVKAVPDGGEVTLATTAAPVSGIRPGSVFNGGSPVNAVYYDCSGRRLSAEPTMPGVYLMGSGNGLQKTVILR